MTSEQQLIVKVSHLYSVSPERVFDAWLDPTQVGRFLFATPNGKMTRVEIDPKVGGKFIIAEQREHVLAEHFGIYREIDRPRRLAFDFSVNAYLKDATSVLVEVTPMETGCELTLTYGMDPAWAEYEDRTRAGWTGILDGLAKVLS